MKPAEFRDMNDSELGEKIKSLREESFNLNVQKQIGQLEDPLKMRALRKDIARVLTVMNERGLKETVGKVQPVSLPPPPEKSKENGETQ
jgi:large subunit ribosomal protein L29